MLRFKWNPNGVSLLIHCSIVTKSTIIRTDQIQVSDRLNSFGCNYFSDSDFIVAANLIDVETTNQSVHNVATKSGAISADSNAVVEVRDSNEKQNDDNQQIIKIEQEPSAAMMENENGNESNLDCGEIIDGDSSLNSSE